MIKETVLPPWIAFPDTLPGDIFWRQEGESWALHVWLPFWSQLTEDERENFLNKHNAPEKWRGFYKKELQDFIATQDGPSGWILRNNLTPCDQKLMRYTSISELQLKPDSFWKRHIYLIIGMFIGLIICIFFKR